LIHAAEVRQYIEQFPKSVQDKLWELHAIIQAVIPSADEIISYKMPAFKEKQVLVYYAGYKNHIGFYPTAQPIEVFKNELKNFKFSKGSIQFPLDQPLPKQLIQEIVQFRKTQVEAITPKSTARSRTS